MKIPKRNTLASLILVVPFLFYSCKKFIEVPPPPGKVSKENVFENDQTATAVLFDLFVDMSNNNSPALSKFLGLSADEFSLWSGADLSHFAYYTNTLFSNTTGSYGTEWWEKFYSSIFVCNSAIEELESASKLSPNIKSQLLGEAYFMRALYYFYLTNLYGDLPLVVGTDVEINRKLKRSSTVIIYNKLIDDLIKAKSLLSVTYVNSLLIPYSIDRAERVRPTSWAAAALLARISLYKGDYESAENYSTQVINNTQLFSMPSLDSVFLKNNREAILQGQPVNSYYNTEDARMFNLSIVPEGLSAMKPLYISSSLLNSFEIGDLRKQKWIGSYSSNGETYYYPNKYKSAMENVNIVSPSAMTEYTMILRLSEQYLIRSEARAQLNKIENAKQDLDLIRHRAGLPDVNANSQKALLTAILKERRIELFSEWGHRWLDIKRFDEANIIMPIASANKGGTWESTDQLYPIPFKDILYNPSLIQNPGYE